MTSWLAGLGLVLALATGPEPRTFRVGPVTVVAWPAESALAVHLAEEAGRPAEWPGLGIQLPAALRLIVVADARQLASITGGRAPAWGAALALPDDRTILVRADADPLRTLRHELAHLALHAAVRVQVPRWFDEGYASYAAGEWGRVDRLALDLAVARGAVPDLDGLDGALLARAEGTADVAYGFAVSAVLELARRNPTHTLTPLLSLLGDGTGFETAVLRTTGLPLARFEEAWQQSVRRRHGLVAWVAAGGGWALLVVVLVVAMRWRRRSDRVRRAALDIGWPPPPDEPPQEPGEGAVSEPPRAAEELDRHEHPR
jgi:hypothetical protein